jgi:hypothetical protein
MNGRMAAVAAAELTHSPRPDEFKCAGTARQAGPWATEAAGSYADVESHV